VEDGVTEDHEQDRTEARDTTARPVTAAARRERRAATRGETPARSVEEKVPTGTRSRRNRQPADGAVAKDSVGTKTLSKEDQGISTPRRGQRGKRPSVIARFARFIREVVGELRKVIWPTRKQQLTYTIVVLVFLTVVVAFVSGLDLGFAKLVFWIFA
jgi:preprotein translocase subunit SecE